MHLNVNDNKINPNLELFGEAILLASNENIFFRFLKLIVKLESIPKFKSLWIRSR